MRAKDLPGVHEVTSNLPAAWRDALRARRDCTDPRRNAACRTIDASRRSGDCECADGARALAGEFGPRSKRCTSDLADLRGYHYHNVQLFSAFTAGDRTRSATAAATTASGRRLAGRVLLPALRWICAALRRARARLPMKNVPQIRRAVKRSRCTFFIGFGSGGALGRPAAPAGKLHETTFVQCR